MTMTAGGIAKLIEECGELQQVLGKRLAMWDRDDHWDGTDIRRRMIDEMGDVMAAIKFVADKNGFLPEVVDRCIKKQETFALWDMDPSNNQHGIDAGEDHAQS